MAVKINEEKCVGCGACTNVCAVEAIEIKKSKAVVNDKCIECGACILQCPVDAISMPA